MLERRLHAIAKGLETLARRDEGWAVFGSERHRHRLGPPLAESDAQGFERDQGVSLPPAYRAFLTRLGNGGAGPFYGLVPLAPVLRADGTLKLSDVGCGYFYLLAVAGPGAGEVWSDTTANRDTGSIEPTGRDFLSWYEDWLDQALETWAAQAVRDAVSALALPLDDELYGLAARAEMHAPTGWESWERIGYLCLASGRPREAQRAFERARDEHPGRGARYWITQCHRHIVLADPAARLRAAEEGLALKPYAADRRELEREKSEALSDLDALVPRS